MSKEAKKAWNKMVPHLEQMKVLTVADGQMLEATCEAYAEFVQARKVVAKDGHTYERITGHGSVTITVRPEVAIAADAWRRLKQGLAEFGMTPASRSRVQVVDAPSDLDPFSLLPGGKAGSAS